VPVSLKVFFISYLEALHRSNRTVLGRAIDALPRNGERAPIGAVSPGFGAGLLPEAQVSNGYE
jgi:hypothetical protein